MSIIHLSLLLCQSTSCSLLDVSHITYIIAHSVEKVNGVVGTARFSSAHSYSSPPIEVSAYIGLVQNLHKILHQLWRYVRVFAVNLSVQLKPEIVMQLLYDNSHNLVGDGDIEQESEQLLVLSLVEAFGSARRPLYLNLLQTSICLREAMLNLVHHFSPIQGDDICVCHNQSRTSRT